MEDTEFSTKDILNFLYSGPEENRQAGLPNFDWRNIFQLTDQVIRMFNQYGEVRKMTRPVVLHKKIAINPTGLALRLFM